jgi:hypothetical protein
VPSARAAAALLAASLVAVTACGRSAEPSARYAELSPGVSFEPRSDWPVPAGWKSETIPFPLEFAPALAHRGVEELRFAPGMFDPAAPGYWSYAFVWWLEDQAPQDAASLAAELTEYFRGLLTSVAAQRARAAAPPPGPADALPVAGGSRPGVLIDVAAITAAVQAAPDAAGWRRFTGEATVLDAFGDGRRVSLRLTLAQRNFSALGRRAVLVLASPAAADQPIWQKLEEVAVSFAPPDP